MYFIPNYPLYIIRHWTPPKGHLDEGETDSTAAKRETLEEAGLQENKDYEIINHSYKIESNYFIGDIAKRVTYWLAKVNDPNVVVKMSEEHQDFKWLNFNQACDIVGYEEMKRVLSVAQDFIIKNVK